MLVEVAGEEGGFDLGGDHGGDGFDEEGDSGGVSDSLYLLSVSHNIREIRKGVLFITSCITNNGIKLPSA